MFALLKKKNPYENAAHAVYAQALDHTRQPVFYEECGVPDSFDGRFDLLVLHVFLVLRRMLDEGVAATEDFNQALFDATFADMDQTLREMGIGDMGVPKHMRKMMKGFNGRVHAYNEGVESGDLKGALRKNVYGTVESVDDAALEKLAQKAQDILACLKTQPAEDILAGRVQFEAESN